MLVKLEFTNKRKLRYKFKWVERTENLKLLICPAPKNKRQMQKLQKALLPFEEKIIYPKGFVTNGFPKEYPLTEMTRRQRLSDFLSYCKAKRPETVVIISKGIIKEQFFIDLSGFVGRIFLPDTPYNPTLSQKILSFSGTPIIFGGEIPKQDENTKFFYI